MAGKRVNKGGRPTLFTQNLAKSICDALACSPVGLRKLCLMRDDFPTSTTVREWITKDDKFADQYMKAMSKRAMWLAEEIEEISDDGTNDTYVDDDGKIKTDYDVLGRSRLRVDTRKWIASKLMPKVYGDHKRMEELETENDVMRREMQELRAQLDEKNKKEF